MDEIRSAQRRAQRHRFADGIGELVTGSALMLAGSGFLIGDLFDSDTLRIVSLVVAFSLVPLGVWMTRSLKERITYPRTGYTRPPRPRLTYLQRLSLNMLLVFLVLPFVHEYVGPSLDADTMTGRVVFLGWIAVMVAPLAIMGVRFRLHRLLWVVGVALGTGGTSILLRIPGDAMIGVLFATGGATAVLTGAWALRSYLRQHPRTEVDSRHDN